MIPARIELVSDQANKDADRDSRRVRNAIRSYGQLLSGIRVVDLTSMISGPVATMMLADQGADVIKVEPPGADPDRLIGPFYHDIGDPEKSLYWFGYNESKRGITLNIEHPEGQELLHIWHPAQVSSSM